MRFVTRVIRLAGALALVASCASQSDAATTRSGINGTVVAGPTCPVETPESPCPDRPVDGAQVTAKRGDETRSTTTDPSGTFRLRLRPGTYTVTAVSDSVFGCDEQRVVVRKRRYSKITVTCDTGIR